MGLTKELTKDEYLSLYETMVKIRVFDETAAAYADSGELCGFVHPYSGEEAIAAGVCGELTKDDCVCSTHRGHGHIIAKGGDVNKMWAELYGKATGYSQGKSGSMHIADISIGIIGANGIVGAGLPIANGVAFALDYQGKDAVCVAFFGDGATNRGTFHEALNLASVWNLPVLFVCENNGFASTTPRAEAMNVARVSERAASYGMTGVTVDGNDPLAVKEAVRAARLRLREGGGQTLLECITWRHHQHFIGDRSDYKDPEDQARWLSEEMDPIPRFEKRILEAGIADERELAEIRERVDAEIIAAVRYGKESPYPAPESMYDFVYAD
ncbi:MAG: thiamine pyrophosphate-dependent dehydrogenase E1 component subunit alpha [Clostridiales Family XIII bacterium]|jgi:pyruvate dehydrogenase E1 component alpha subunit|nr:thiamine pyrophosphate-dependent dehydrogenase E1 component subunit alpha [Clostridiales Family XIII bacterium]